MRDSRIGGDGCDLGAEGDATATTLSNHFERLR